MTDAFLLDPFPLNISCALVGFGTCCILFLKAHWRCLVSLVRVVPVTACGVSTKFSELLIHHCRCFLQGCFVKDRDKLVNVVEQSFRSILKPAPDTNVLITHSCRVLFLCVIQTLLDEAEERTGRRKIRICLPSVHFGSFHTLLKNIQNSGIGEIDYYEIDFKPSDLTLDLENIDPELVKKCDLILGMHIFGVPLEQDSIFELGKRFDIPIFEDNVQCGSLFGQYKGHALADICVWSGGIDKTPSCIGAGFGAFRATKHGQRLYEKCLARHEGFTLDTYGNRLMSVLKQTVHLMISHNTFFMVYIVSLAAYFLLGQAGGHIKFYAISLKVRKTKSITPFEHAVEKFCHRPSVPHLLSMRYGLSKADEYAIIAIKEQANRDLLLRHTPKKFHSKLFPWLTKQVQHQHKENLGISELTWLASEVGGREKLVEFLNDNFVIALINTTWDYTNSKCVGADINESLIYLPNLLEMTPTQVVYVGQVLTKWCELEYGGMIKK